MKKIYLTVLSCATFLSVLTAQTPCNNGRYSTDTYTAITTSTAIPYGQNTTFSSSTQTLTFDFYEPTADTSQARPLIIWAHGGSFISGTSANQDVVSLSQDFAKKGFVCASINYRLGFFPIDSANALKAVVRAVQDMKAAVRFFYKDKLTSNTYKIDTNNIFIGGSSAGAIMALHVAYLDKDCELQPYMNSTNLAALGGLAGTSGNAGYSTKVKGVINLCGALAQYGWLEAGDVPFCSMHGTTDGTVKYSRGKVNPGVSLIYLDGSRMLKEQAVAANVPNNFYTFYGADHVPYAGTTATQLAYMDTTVNFVRDFLISRLNCTDAALQAPNTPFATATLSGFKTGCLAGIKENQANNVLQEIFPNPSSDYVKIVFINSSSSHSIVLTDITGKTVRSEVTSDNSYTLEKNNLAPGIYLLKATNAKGESSVQKIIFY